MDLHTKTHLIRKLRKCCNSHVIEVQEKTVINDQKSCRYKDIYICSKCGEFLNKLNFYEKKI